MCVKNEKMHLVRLSACQSVPVRGSFQSHEQAALGSAGAGSRDGGGNGCRHGGGNSARCRGVAATSAGAVVVAAGAAVQGFGPLIGSDGRRGGRGFQPPKAAAAHVKCCITGI